MSSHTQTETLDAWFAYLSSSCKDDAFYWAWEAVDSAVRDTPPLGWSLVLQLIGRAPSNEALAHVAAGPLEDFIVQHVGAYIGQIEDQARDDPKFRLALTGVWCEGDIPIELFEKLSLLTSSVSDPL
ncbi:MAG: hypothetical protein FHP92_15060 [Denitromonas halophila]|nr:MAG: hypothetical protein FHP94_12930 [Denitromonas halophila]TVT70779.1 MAG: hypothetical protein FHP93_11110 [Denitromonas halophila]TVT72922.1 MAG: hypothetical protein FHP92_15060 [Denitromonas halophila]